MKQILTALSAALVCAAVLADTITVSNVQMKQRWPWNCKVDITYTLQADSPNTTNPVFAVSFSAKIGETSYPVKTVSGDGATGLAFNNGVHVLTWDTEDEVLPHDIQTNDMTVTVKAEDVTAQAAYLKLDLATGKMVNAAAAPETYSQADKTTSMWFKRIEPQTFVMGSGPEEVDREPVKLHNEALHSVTLTKAFYLGVFELTQGQVATIGYTGAPACQYTGANQPQDSISYDELRGTKEGATWPVKTDRRVDTNSFLGVLRNLTGNALLFDLPTDAQWELACRAGHGSGYWNDGSAILGGNPDSNLDVIAWYNHTGNWRTHEVGTKKPNSWGLYDMIGNVHEWCVTYFACNSDCVEKEFDAMDPAGPTAEETIANRALRSSSFGNVAPYCRPAYRNSDPSPTHDHTVGARIGLFF